MYINEIIRITYKCNWKCKFCNVLQTNNFWDKDISKKEIISKILNLIKKYSKEDLKNLILSFSWWEPTLNKNLSDYIKLAKKIWVWNVQIQTNGSIIYKNPIKLIEFIDSWLDEIFIANHSHLEEINKKMWVFYNKEEFINFINFYKKNDLKLKIQLNIVINKINLFNIYDFILFLKNSLFLDILTYKMISFWFVQANWYAQINKEDVLLKFDQVELNEISNIINLCRKNNLSLDFHFTAPPLCILNYPEYNLEYERLKKIKQDKIDWNINQSNLESYEFLWKEKERFKKCEECKYNNYCLWFYKNFINFVWENYINDKINNFLIL